LPRTGQEPRHHVHNRNIFEVEKRHFGDKGVGEYSGMTQEVDGWNVA